MCSKGKTLFTDIDIPLAKAVTRFFVWFGFPHSNTVPETEAMCYHALILYDVVSFEFFILFYYLKINL